MSAFLKALVVLALAFALFTLASSESALARLDPGSNAAALVSAAPDALPLDHFYCYRVKEGLPVNQTVLLKDQFDQNFLDAVVGVALRLCNPVEKTHNGKVFKVTHPNDHLVWYKIGTPVAPPQIKVDVNNQFGKRRLKVYLPAEALAVPSQKLPHDPPKDTDHFKCYRVKGDAINVPVGLKDQFQATQVSVLRPVYLCNPTIKNHNGALTDIKYPQAHLVCYTVTPKDFVKKVTTINQFRQENLKTSVADLLCAPSKKEIVH